MSEVSLGRAGIIAGIEVSRLSRSSSDWTRLLQIAALSDTLIMDEDGIYDVNDFNDRLLLGLKGTLSGAELHYLRARMRGGLLNKGKARRTPVSSFHRLCLGRTVDILYDRADVRLQNSSMLSPFCLRSRIACDHCPIRYCVASSLLVIPSAPIQLKKLAQLFQLPIVTILSSHSKIWDALSICRLHTRRAFAPPTRNNKAAARFVFFRTTALFLVFKLLYCGRVFSSYYPWFFALKP